jgi:hypothetical protein
MSVLGSDAFTRADNPASLGANWTPDAGPSNVFGVVSNQCVPQSVGSDAASIWNAATWPNDQYSQVVITGMSAGDGDQSGGGVTLRADAGFHNLYRIVVNRRAANNVSIARIISDVYSLRNQRTVAFNSGDTFRVEIQGTTIRMYVNGVQVGADFVDAGGPASGSAGLFYSSTTAAIQFDSWEGGDLGVQNQLAWVRA